MNKKTIAQMGIMFAMLANGQPTIRRSDHPLKMPERVTPPIPKGAKVWPEYGNVIAINKANAIKKFNKLK